MQPFQCDLQPQLQETHRTTHTGTTIVAKHIEGTKRPQPQPPHIQGTFHRRLQPLYTEKTQGFVLRLRAQNKAHATFMQPFQCDLQPQLQETHRTTHTGSTIVAKHIEGTKRPQPQPPHTRGTFHRRLQPLYTEKPKVSCSGFLPNSPFPFLTASHRHHFPSSPPPFVHFPSSPLPFLTTSHRPHLPSSPFPFIITSLRHHFPSSPLPFVTTSLRHHFPSSPLPFVTTSLRHHFPSSPPVIITTLYQSQFHCFLFFCYVLLYYVLLPPCIISSRRILFVRNTEVLLSNFL